MGAVLIFTSVDAAAPPSNAATRRALRELVDRWDAEASGDGLAVDRSTPESPAGDGGAFSFGADDRKLANDPRVAPMGILDYLVSLSEEYARKMWPRVLDQRRTLERLELEGDSAAVHRARLVLVSLEQAYR